MNVEVKKNLEQQLWNIANTLRGKMGADEFRDYILGFIFYKYLSEKMGMYANHILKQDGINLNQMILLIFKSIALYATAMRCQCGANANLCDANG